MNVRLFKSIMMINGDTNKTLAKYLGLSEQSISNKINENGTEFKQSEIAKLKVKWNLSAEQVEEIFFN